MCIIEDIVDLKFLEFFGMLDSLIYAIFHFVGRHRWVEYAEKGRYNASQVPPEWHGWLHHMTDHTGDEVSHFFKLNL